MAEVDLTIRADTSQYIASLQTAVNAQNEVTNSAKQARDAYDAINKEIQELTRWEKAALAEGASLTEEEKKRLAELKKQKAAIDANVKSQDQQTTAVQKTKSATSGLSNQFKQLGRTIIAAFSIAAVTRFVKASIEAFNKQEKAVRSLRFALQGNEAITQRMIAQAGQLQKTTVFGDEEIIQAQAFLAVQGKNEDQIKKTIEAAIGLSTIMGQDLQTAVFQLSGTYEGQIGRMSKLDKRIGELSKTELAQGKAVDIIREKYAGLAQEMSLTLSGKLQSVSNLWGDLKESIGAFLGYQWGSLVNSAKQSLGGITDIFGTVGAGTADVETQKKKFEILAQAAMKPNLSMERRIELIKQMQRIEPGFLNDIDIEKASFEQLSQAYAESIKQMNSRVDAVTFNIRQQEIYNSVAQEEAHINRLRSEAAADLAETNNKGSRSFLEVASSIAEVGQEASIGINFWMRWIPGMNKVIGSNKLALANLREEFLNTDKATAEMNDTFLNLASEGFKQTNWQVQLLDRYFLQFIGDAKELQKLKDLWHDYATTIKKTGDKETDYTKLSLANLEKMAKDGDEKAKAEIERRKKATEAAQKHADAVKNYTDKLKELNDEARKSAIDQTQGTEKIMADYESRLEAINQFRDELLKAGQVAYGKDYQLTAEAESAIEQLRVNTAKETNELLKQVIIKRREDAKTVNDGIASDILEQNNAELDLNEQKYDALQKRRIAEFNLIEEDATKRKEFEIQVQKETLKFLIETSQKRISLLKDYAKATGENMDNQIQAIEIMIQNYNTELMSLDTSGGKEGKTLLAKALGVDDDQLDALLNNINAVEGIADRLLSAWDRVAQAKVTAAEKATQAVEDELSAAEDALNAEYELQKQGLANNVSIEQQRVNELKAARDRALANEKEAQKQQERINTLQQASSLVTGVANALSIQPVWLGLLTAAALVVEFFALKSSVESQLAEGGAGDSTGIIKGKRHSEGGERFTDHIEVEAGEQWGVLNRRATNKYKNVFPDVVNALNKGDTYKASLLLNGLARPGLDRTKINTLKEMQNSLVVNNDYGELQSEMKAVKDEISKLRKDNSRGKKILSVGDGYYVEQEGNVTRKVITK